MAEQRRDWKRGDYIRGGIFPVENQQPVQRGAFLTSGPSRPGATTDDDPPSLDDIKKMIELTRQKVEALAAQVRQRR
jgi:hypothetical protein